METLTLSKRTTEKKPVRVAKKANWSYRLWLLFYPVGIFRIWKSTASIWWKLAYSVLGFPLFIIGFIYSAIVCFALFLPALDRSVGNRSDRTIVNAEGNYSARFVKTGQETNGAYELVEVELEPHGGNDWHYHNRFTEEFTVLKGKVNIGHEGKEMPLTAGKIYAVEKNHMHYFKNALNERSVLLVKIAPAGGLEKTLRVAYGLINDGLLKNDMTENPWHMCLLLAYSESYLPGMPSWFQEPLINSLAKIAQWKGEDRSLYKYFK